MPCFMEKHWLSIQNFNLRRKKMKIAIPVKMNRENPPLAPLFGKAKWFAIVDNGEITIKENPANGGHEVVHWLASLGVNALIIQEMGRNPFDTVKQYETIRVFHGGFERILLDEALAKLEKHELIELNDEESRDAIINHHEKRHPAHDHEHGEGHHHHHHH
ncbi:MAG TPA: hypothetical protein ENK95_00565 [Campylobacterales bacterium]|nr:hypothetical protein [Campylobacterales bacterium]